MDVEGRRLRQALVAANERLRLLQSQGATEAQLSEARKTVSGLMDQIARSGGS